MGGFGVVLVLAHRPVGFVKRSGCQVAALGTDPYLGDVGAMAVVLETPDQGGTAASMAATSSPFSSLRISIIVPAREPACPEALPLP